MAIQIYIPLMHMKVSSTLGQHFCQAGVRPNFCGFLFICVEPCFPQSHVLSALPEILIGEDRGPSFLLLHEIEADGLWVGRKLRDLKMCCVHSHVALLCFHSPCLSLTPPFFFSVSQLSSGSPLSLQSGHQALHDLVPSPHLSHMPTWACSFPI